MAGRRSHIGSIRDLGDLRDTSNFNAPIVQLDDGLKTFGIPMSVLMKRPDHSNEKIPLIIKHCCQALYKNARKYYRGIYTHGIFRESGAADRVTWLREIFDKGEYPKHAARNGYENALEMEDPHVVSSLMKAYLRDLPEPLMRYENVDPIISVVKSMKGLEEEIMIILKIMKERMKQLSPVHATTLRVMLHLLYETSQLSAINKMVPSNLGITFGQVFFRPIENEKVITEALMNANHLNKATEIMIQHYDQIFADVLDEGDQLRFIFPKEPKWVVHDFVSETEVEVLNGLYGVEPPAIEEAASEFIKKPPKPMSLPPVIAFDEEFVFGGDKDVEQIDEAMSEFHSMIKAAKKSKDRETYEKLKKIYQVLYPAVYDVSGDPVDNIQVQGKNHDQPLPIKFVYGVQKMYKNSTHTQLVHKLATQQLAYTRKHESMKKMLRQVMNSQFNL